ncbi:hypothetical protein LINPERPRIM_LOCUS39860, partial [Linum perenne]
CYQIEKSDTRLSIKKAAFCSFPLSISSSSSIFFTVRFDKKCLLYEPVLGKFSDDYMKVPCFSQNHLQ